MEDDYFEPVVQIQYLERTRPADATCTILNDLAAQCHLKGRIYAARLMLAFGGSQNGLALKTVPCGRRRGR